jgi:hypothetical protein
VLDALGATISSRLRLRLERRLLSFDPRHPTPEEWLERLGAEAA